MHAPRSHYYSFAPSVLAMLTEFLFSGLVTLRPGILAIWSVGLVWSVGLCTLETQRQTNGYIITIGEDRYLQPFKYHES